MVRPVKQDVKLTEWEAADYSGEVSGSPTDFGDPVRCRVLDAAETLFYARGIQAVGIDAVRDEAGISLKRLYQLFPGKEQLVVGVLERRDARWRGSSAAYVERVQDPEDRIFAVFDWLGAWFADPGFRGCMWINAFGELGALSPPIAQQARLHKAQFRAYLERLARRADLPPRTADQLALLAEGAIVTAAIAGTPIPASQARAAAETLIRAVRS